MSNDVRRLYWDACVFISYIEATAGRVETISELLDQARRGDIEVITSVASRVEVAFAKHERDGGRLDPAVEEAIDELWSPSSPIKPVELDGLIANRARDLIRSGLDRGWRLRPIDAIHLATAAQVGVHELNTYSHDLRRYSEVLTFPVRAPVAAQPQLPEQ